MHRNKEIDFSLAQFEAWYHSNLPPERLSQEVYFCNLPFHLMNNVFCPRHETEMVVEELNKLTPLSGNYIDICSGSGVIGITILKHHPHLKGTLLDLSPAAIKNIEINLIKHSVQAQVIECDWLEYLSQNPNYQIITANFPYISSDDPTDDLDSDPSIALYSSDNGWEHYDKLIKWLKTNSHWQIVVLECSAYHRKQWQSVENLNVQLVNDINDLLRIAVIKRA